MQAELKENAQAAGHLTDLIESMKTISPHLTEWEERTIRQLVSSVRVLSADRIQVIFKCGLQSEQTIQ